MSTNIVTDLQPLSSKQTFIGNNELRPYYECSKRFHIENERSKTFESWPLDWLDKKILAMTGMFYTGRNDNTKCYFCEIVIGKWEYGDDPVQEHLRWSPNCPLLRRRLTNNVPVNASNLETVLPSASENMCVISDMPPPTKNTIPCTDYTLERVRLHSFAEWPRSIKQKPVQLAEAGFFYTGIGDRVICFSCEGGLKDWDDDDEPWEQHALWMGHCPYVRLIKGEHFIENVIRKFRNLPPKDVEVKEEINRNIDVKTENKTIKEQTSLSSSSPVGPLDLPEFKECKICFENECNTAFSPCGHVVSCGKCAFSVSKCPVCRSAIANVVRLYFA